MRTARLLPLCRLALALACLCAALAACQTAASPPTALPSATPTPAATATATATPSPVPPNLEGGGALARRCDQYQMFAARPMVPGQLAVDFTLKDTKGKEYTLSRLLAEKPVVMIFGSFT